ncbi:hypothetical protein Tco_0417386 [Tanacetum coccineum]
MSSSPHSTVVPSDSDNENTFSSTNILNYFPASPGNISPNSSDDFTKYLLDILLFPPLHDDPYIQAYDVIPPSQVIIALPAIVPPSMSDSRDFFPPKEISSPEGAKNPVKSPNPMSTSSSVGFSSPDPITPPVILTPSPVLPPSLLFDPRYFFVPEELLPPKKQIHSPSSSSTTLSNSSRNQTCDLISPSSSVYTPTPPQIFEIGKCSVKMHLKHHEEQIEDILNYLDELSFHRIEKMEERRINGNELKTELKEIRTQIIKLQKKRLGQKDKIAFAHYRISDLEQIIEKIQARHQTDQEDL